MSCYRNLDEGKADQFRLNKDLDTLLQLAQQDSKVASLDIFRNTLVRFANYYAKSEVFRNIPPCIGQGNFEKGLFLGKPYLGTV